MRCILIIISNIFLTLIGVGYVALGFFSINENGGIIFLPIIILGFLLICLRNIVPYVLCYFALFVFLFYPWIWKIIGIINNDERIIGGFIPIRLYYLTFFLLPPLLSIVLAHSLFIKQYKIYAIFTSIMIFLSFATITASFQNAYLPCTSVAFVVVYIFFVFFYKYIFRRAYYIHSSQKP